MPITEHHLGAEGRDLRVAMQLSRGHVLSLARYLLAALDYATTEDCETIPFTVFTSGEQASLALPLLNTVITPAHWSGAVYLPEYGPAAAPDPEPAEWECMSCGDDDTDSMCGEDEEQCCRCAHGDDGDFPLCDLCGGPDDWREWNGDTGCHVACESDVAFSQTLAQPAPVTVATVMDGVVDEVTELYARAMGRA